MLEKGEKRSTRSLTYLLKELQGKSKTLVGASYASNTLGEEIPVSTLVEELVLSKSEKDNQLVQGTIYFRPVGDAQRRNLVHYMDIADYYGFGSFQEGEIQEPLVPTKFEYNLVSADSSLSNIQEVPFDFFLVNPEVYIKHMTLKGNKLTQYTLVDTTHSGNVDLVNTLTLLIMEREYDLQTLLGYYADEPLKKSEGLRLLQLVGNGSLVPYVIGAVSLFTPSFSGTSYPLYSDYQLHFLKDEEESVLSVTSDVGSFRAEEKDIREIGLRKTGNEKFELSIESKDSTLFILIG